MSGRMNKTKLKQGTLVWETARENRIGSSEIFDIVRYYAKDNELQNCGIDSEKFRQEEPYTTAWALYHKMLNDGLYDREELAPELAEYGHAVEPYGTFVLQNGRKKKLKRGEVYMSDRLICSLDVAGIAEDVDVRAFDFGTGTPKVGMKFVAEQKSMIPVAFEKGIQFKHVTQAQYQVNCTNSDFYIIQVMVLDEDSAFIRGKVCQMGIAKRKEYLKKHLTVHNLYIENNLQLGALIQTCLERFFTDVEARNEPMPFIPTDKQANILKSIRTNSFYNDKLRISVDLTAFEAAKREETAAKNRKQEEQQKIIAKAKEFNGSQFDCPSGKWKAKFSTDGKFLLQEVKEARK